jgi:hypothetical protein
MPRLADTTDGRGLQHERLVEGLREPRRERLRVLSRLHAGPHDHELVPGEPGQRVALREPGLEPLGDGDQQLVAGGVPERVVDALELVEVDEGDRHLTVGAGHPGECLRDPVAEQDPVGQGGERVVQALVRQRLLGALGGRDVDVGQHRTRRLGQRVHARLNHRASCGVEHG